MNLNQLLAWLSSNKITVAERVPTVGGEVLIFTGTRPFPWDGRPQWFALPIKNGQARITVREIEALLRHFAHGELQIPRAPAAIGGNLAVQPLHPQNPLDRKD